VRRRLTALGRAVAAAFGPIGNSVSVETPRLAFWQLLPASARAYLADDIKLLIGWTFDAAACGASLAPSPVIDARSGFERVPGFAAPTPMQGLVGRYRVLRAFDHGRGYYGIAFAALEGSDRAVALLLLNRLFRMPIAHRDPLGLVTDVVTNGPAQPDRAGP
jgi:hypothetical protein